MQYKTKLLTGVVTSAAILSLAGTASALQIPGFSLDGSTSAGTFYFSNPTAANFVAPKYANEITNTADTTVGDDRDNGKARVQFDVETGTFPSGNVLMDVTITGATFDLAGGNYSGSNFNFNNCTAGDAVPKNATAVLSVQDPTGNVATHARFVISNLDDCQDGANPSFDVPFDATPGSSVTLTVSIVTESGNVQVDGGARTFTILTAAPAFPADIDAYADNVADVASTVGPYRTFVGNTANAQIGDLEIQARTDVLVDLNGDGYVSPSGAPSTLPVFASSGNVTNTTVTITGDFSAYLTTLTPAGSVTVGGTAASSLTATTAVIVGSGIVTSGTGTTFVEADPTTAIVNLNASTSVPIQASTYTVSIATSAGTGISVPVQTGALGRVIRNGTTALLPWTASQTQAAGSGSRNFVRVSNPTGTTYGLVKATVLASTVPAQVGVSATLATTVAPGAEVLFDDAALQTALGNFGRGDVLITVEGNNATIKRLIQRTDGTYEINNVGVIGPNAN